MTILWMGLCIFCYFSNITISPQNYNVLGNRGNVYRSTKFPLVQVSTVLCSSSPEEHVKTSNDINWLSHDNYVCLKILALNKGRTIP